MRAYPIAMAMTNSMGNPSMALVKRNHPLENFKTWSIEIVSTDRVGLFFHLILGWE